MNTTEKMRQRMQQLMNELVDLMIGYAPVNASPTRTAAPRVSTKRAAKPSKATLTGPSKVRADPQKARTTDAERVLDFLHRLPQDDRANGLRTEEIYKSLGMDKEDAKRAIAELRASKKIKKRGERRATRWRAA